MSGFAINRSIPLTQGKVTWVDQEDYTELARHKWCAARRGRRWYAQNYDLGYMHRFILAPPAGREVDHINGDGLDNRRCNLRVATRAENNANRANRQHSSLYRGVSFDYDRNRWQAFIAVGGCRHRFLGRYTDEVAAALAYDLAALEQFGSFATLNFLAPEVTS